MTFIEYLKSFSDGLDPVFNGLAIESTFREKLPYILEFVSGSPFIDLVLTFDKIKTKQGCIIQIKNEFFTLTALHKKNKKYFSCDIDFKIEIKSISKHIKCQFDEDLNIQNFSYQLDFGNYMTNNIFYIENTKYFDGSHKRKLYFQSRSTYATKVIKINPDVHNEDREFEIFLSKILLINYENKEFYKNIFHYLPVIDMFNTSLMSNFINDLHNRHVKKDIVLKHSLILLDMYNI